MASHNELGKKGEQLAAAFLRDEGYQILETNWVSGKAEIDLIVRKGNVLAVVEVKTRSSTTFGLPQDFVNPKKIRLLVQAVNDYVERRKLDVEVRFDIIAVVQQQGKITLEHLPNAFYHF